MFSGNNTSPRINSPVSRVNEIELLADNQDNNPQISYNAATIEVEDDTFVPYASKVDFIDKGNMVVRVMDEHNFYEALQMTEEYLNDAPVGLLTKIWISISKSLKE